MDTSDRKWDGTEQLRVQLRKLGIRSSVAHTGGGCWVVTVQLNGGWEITASRSDGPEVGYYYAIDNGRLNDPLQGGWGPEVGPKQAAKRVRALVRGLGEIF
jgi:hypothetical protein